MGPEASEQPRSTEKDPLISGLHNFIEHHRTYNTLLPEHIRQPEKTFEFLEDFYNKFLEDRNKRATEVSQEKYEKEIVPAIRDLFPMSTFFIQCVDGRVKPVHTNGLSAETASSLRTPGGHLNEFNRQDGELVLDENSTFAEKLLLAGDGSDFISQVFDSHWACAARENEESDTGNHPKDKGLLQDVLHKREMIQATRIFLKKHGPSEQNTALIQTTFDPITDYEYMGLETTEALEVARQASQQKTNSNGSTSDSTLSEAEYTKDIIEKLIRQGKIISTGHLLTDPKILAALKENRFEIDRINDYVGSAEKFAIGLKNIKEQLLSQIEQLVLKLYPHLKSEDKSSKKELEQRAMLLLSNTYNAYLNNSDHNEMEYLREDDEQYEKEDHYAFDKHDEAGIKVTEGGHPPYNISMFVVHSQDRENMPGWVVFASSIVRTNRRLERIMDASSQFTTADIDKYEKAPVPVVVQEIIRNQGDITIPENDWDQLQQIDWEDIPTSWECISTVELRKYLTTKGISHTLLMEGILQLRDKMARLYDESRSSADHLKNLSLTALPTICDSKRKTVAIIPFIKVARNKLQR